MAHEEIVSAMAKIERHLKAMQEVDDREGAVECLELLHKHMTAWEALYRPPPPKVYPEHVMPMGRPGWSDRTIAST